MIKVLTVGVFDFFHYGHLRLFERAHVYGDYLIVAVQDGEYIKKYKPEADVLYSTEQRVHLVESLRLVDEVDVYTDVDSFIQTIDFDVFVVGEDQTHEGFMRATDWCAENGKRVVRLQRTKGISSSEIKSRIDLSD